LSINTTQYHQEGANTFRRSSRAIVEGWGNYIIRIGTNLQNIEQELRRIYHAKGYNAAIHLEKCIHYLKTKQYDHFTSDELKTLNIFNQSDQAGAEALIVAYLCSKGKFRDLFLNNIKPHVFVALHLFSSVWQEELNKISSGDFKISIQEFLGRDIRDLQKHHYWKTLDNIIKSSDGWEGGRRYYYIGKKVCHAGNYGMRGNTFRLAVLEESRGQIALTKQQADEYIRFYHMLFPEISEWHRDTIRQLEATRTLYNLFGYPKYFGQEIRETMFNEAYSFVPQSTVACITAKAYCKLQDFIESNNLNWDLLADTHDSYMLQTPIQESLEALKIMKSFIEQDLISPRNEPFKMRAECQHGFIWCKAKEKYPEGMTEVKLN